MRARSRVLPFLLLAASAGPATLTPRSALADESWQYNLAQANTYYRNHLLPKALDALKLVVADSEGAKQLKAWQLIVEISGRLRDLDTLIWALEKGRESATGQEAAQMQAQLYRLKRVYGLIEFRTEGGGGKLPKKGLKLKVAAEPEDPEVKAFLEKAVGTLASVGYSMGRVWLPAGDYELDGEPLTVTAGKESQVEVAPTTEVTFALEIGGVGGYRAGDVKTGASGFLGGLDVGFGPHIQFASGNALVVHLGPLAVLGAQGTRNFQQNNYEPDSRARASVGGTVMVGFEFRLGQVDLSPRLGYFLGYTPSGLYFTGSVISRPENEASAILEGEFIVPAFTHGPRLGVQALVTPATVKGKRRPRLFVGVHGGPVWLAPQWGSVAAQQAVEGTGAEARDDVARRLGTGPFEVLQINASDAQRARAFADVQAVLGVQVRL